MLIMPIIPIQTLNVSVARISRQRIRTSYPALSNNRRISLESALHMHSYHMRIEKTSTSPTPPEPADEHRRKPWSSTRPTDSIQPARAEHVIGAFTMPHSKIGSTTTPLAYYGLRQILAVGSRFWLRLLSMNAFLALNQMA